jgi:hypothetical protein
LCFCYSAYKVLIIRLAPQALLTSAFISAYRQPRNYNRKIVL